MKKNLKYIIMALTLNGLYAVSFNAKSCVSACQMHEENDARNYFEKTDSCTVIRFGAMSEAFAKSDSASKESSSESK